VNDEIHENYNPTIDNDITLYVIVLHMILQSKINES
jgi:hypothetical protein